MQERHDNDKIESHNHNKYPNNIGYNTGTRALPDIYALALDCCMPLGIMHIRISGKGLVPV